MPTLDNLATRFAHCVSLFRDPTAKAEQKKECRALLGLLQDTAVTLRLAQGGSGIEVNGVPCEGAGVAVLVERLDLHGIGEIALPANPPPAQLFELLQALADQPGAHDVTSRLAAAGADRIRIAPVGQPPSAAAPRGPVASSEDFGAREPVIPNPDTPVDRKSGALGTAGILRGESMRDIKSVPLAGVPLVTHDPLPPKAADALPGVVDRAAPRKESGADELLSLSSERQAKPAPPRAAPTPPPSASPPAPPPSQPGPPPAAVHEAVRPPGARATPTGRVALPPGAVDVLADLEHNSTSPTVGDLLAALIDLAASAAKLGRFEQVLGVISGITRVEEKVSEASGVRRQYTIALRRIYTKPVLEGLSRLLAAPKHRAAAVAALQRGGAAGVEVLMDVLAAAPTVGERRAVFDALKHMTEGTDQLVHMLEHSQWFVVRNVAELVRPLRHVLQGVEHRTPLAHRRRRRQYIHQHLHARGPAALQGRHRGGPVLGRRKQSGEALENRLGVDAPQRDRILPAHAARLRNLLLHARDTGDHAQHLLEAPQLGCRRGEIDQRRQEVAHGR